MNIFRAINKWIAPYKYDNEVVQVKKERTNKKKKIKVSKITKADKKPTELDAVNRGELGIKIINLKSPINDESAFQKLDNSASHIAYYYHSKDKHQIAVRFEPRSGFRYYKRNDIKRKNMKVLIEAKNKPTDKTHLIPIGFHGSDSDPRLLIGWSRTLNRGSIKNHEERVTIANKDHTIYWFVNVEKHKGGAYWTSTVWFEDGDLFERKKFNDKDEFYWSF